MFRQTFSWALLAGLTLPLAAPAAVLTKLNESGRRAILSGPELEFAQIGDQLKIGANCEVVIDRKLSEGDNKVGVSTERCKDKLALQVGAEGALISVVGDSTELESTNDIVTSTPRMRTRARNQMVTEARLPREKMMSGIGVGLVMSGLSKQGNAKQALTTQGFVGNRIENSLEKTDTTTGAAGVNLNYSWVPRMGLGVTADLLISQADKIMGDDSFMFARPAVNVAFGAFDKFYAIAGVNYMYFVQQPEYQGGAFDGQTIELRPDLGWQVGAGMVIKDQWQGQLQYAQASQAVRQKLSVDKAQGVYSAAEVNGGYDFSSVELTLQYRF